MPHSIHTEAKGLVFLAAPIILTLLVQVLMHLTDMLMLGRYDAVQFAAAGLGGTLWFVPLLLLMGSLQGVAALIANAIGEGNALQVKHTFQQGMWIAIGLAVLATILLPLIARSLLLTDVRPEISMHAIGYLDILAFAVPAVSLYMAMVYYCEGIEFVYPMLLIQLCILPLNFIGNYALIFGHWGFPELGLRGAGTSTVINTYIGAIALYLFLRNSPRAQHYQPFSTFSKPKWPAIKMILALGLPIAVSMFLEHSIFMASFVMMGHIGVLAAAAHNVAMSYTELIFMVPMGLASATMVKVGNARGRKDFPLMRMRAWIGVGLAALFMLLSAMVILLFKQHIAGFYTNETDIVALGASLLLFAAIFQLSDGVQVTAAGALRGLEDTRVTMVICLVAYWLVGLPLSAYFGFRLADGGPGIWKGLIVGLTVAAVLMVWRLRWALAREQHLANRCER